MLFVRLFDLRLLDLSVSSSSWGLGRAAVCDCGTPWTFHLPFLYMADKTAASDKSDRPMQDCLERIEQQTTMIL